MMGENPMLNLDDIKVEFESQGFKGTHLGISPEKDKTVMFMESVRSRERPSQPKGYSVVERRRTHM